MWVSHVPGKRDAAGIPVFIFTSGNMTGQEGTIFTGYMPGRYPKGRVPVAGNVQ